ncbi:hypothetical protein BDF20DRAFT_832832 [Mycotypha africana]|uniref:uncharacterized protein n=1 Tax=Mycotypha africana TaxID=64632 RepID=UPI002301B028|nr:uncharacterized protein BDF20DRAFT_832832 [Mycotypha africana]KAI8987946.1 hypothetical protein BDF20DRAFT_832832 [Mycotypha africana]
MSDSEEDEGIINYAQLLHKKSGKTKKNLTRGGKQNTNQCIDEQQLEVARQALFECLSYQESQQINIKQLSEGRLNKCHPFWTVITKSKGTHLHTMGLSRQGAIHLYPEEAAFLISRNALLVTKTTDGALCDYETYCDIMCNEKDGWITYDKYQVYAYLKRLGFIVMRSSSTYMKDNNNCETNNSNMRRGCSYTTTIIWQTFRATISSWIDDCRKRAGSPILYDYKVTHYKTAYSTLQVIPSTPWYRPFQESQTKRVEFDWDVYKPRPTWKKRDPGQPDFRIKVQNMHDPLPTLSVQNQLFSQIGHAISNGNYLPHLKNTKLGMSGPTFIIALVGNAEGVIFLRVTGDGLENISVKEKCPVQKRNRQPHSRNVT